MGGAYITKEKGRDSRRGELIQKAEREGLN